MNICGVLIRSEPGNEVAVSVILSNIEGVEVHQTADQGRIVITIEDTPNASAIDTLRAVDAIKGVIASSLVFHNFEIATGSNGPAGQGESCQ